MVPHAGVRQSVRINSLPIFETVCEIILLFAGSVSRDLVDRRLFAPAGHTKENPAERPRGFFSIVCLMLLAVATGIFGCTRYGLTRLVGCGLALNAVRGLSDITPGGITPAIEVTARVLILRAARTAGGAGTARAAGTAGPTRSAAGLSHRRRCKTDRKCGDRDKFQKHWILLFLLLLPRGRTPA